jgi:hypothetical protein
MNAKIFNAGRRGQVNWGKKPRGHTTFDRNGNFKQVRFKPFLRTWELTTNHVHTSFHPTIKKALKAMHKGNPSGRGVF